MTTIHTLPFDMVAGELKRYATYTSGTGTFTPLVDNARCFVRMIGGGGSGGGGNSGSGGGASGMVEFALRVPIAGLAYTVGAGGARASSLGNIGGDTYFGGRVTRGGGPGHPAADNIGGYGTAGSYGAGGVDNPAGLVSRTGSSGVGLGAGGSGGAGLAAGGDCVGGFPGGGVGVGGNSGSGGGSFYGSGGTGAGAVIGNSGNGYGAGGGGSYGSNGGTGAGGGGFIEIWEFGA